MSWSEFIAGIVGSSLLGSIGRAIAHGIMSDSIQMGTVTSADFAAGFVTIFYLLASVGGFVLGIFAVRKLKKRQ